MQTEQRPSGLLSSSRQRLLVSVAVNCLVIANEIRLIFGTKEVLGKHGHCFGPLRSSGADKSSKNGTKTGTNYPAAF